MAAINEHARVILTKTMPEERLEAGDVGTVVHVYRDGRAYEVEFTTLDGRTAAVVTVEASDGSPATKSHTHGHLRVSSTMTSDKQRAIKSVHALPDEATLADAIERLQLVARIDEGLRQSEAGLLTDHEDVKKR